MPAHIGTFGVCPTAQADTKANPKRANFADPHNKKTWNLHYYLKKNYNFVFINHIKRLL